MQWELEKREGHSDLAVFMMSSIKPTLKIITDKMNSLIFRQDAGSTMAPSECENYSHPNGHDV
jgi:hypothetical protein